MKVEKLYVDDNFSTDFCGYMCGNCHSVYDTEEKAEACCKPVTCSVCGRELITDRTKCRDYFYTNPTMCCSCHTKQREDSWETITEEEYWKRVKEENSDYGPVVDGDKWYTDLTELIEDLTTEDHTLEDLRSMRFRVGQILKPIKIHLDRLLEWEEEDMGLEEVDHSVWEDLQSLEDFVKEWNDKQTFRIWECRDLWVTLSEQTLRTDFEYLFEE